MFDVDALMNATVQESNSTFINPLPAGDLNAVIDKASLAQGNKDGKPWVRLDVVYDVTSPETKEATGLEEPKAFQTIFLELRENGTLNTDIGKNIPLGKLRVATGLNEPGQPFNFSMFVGKPVIVHIKNEVNKQDPDGGLRSVVARVTARS